jgi:hypothetical protein
VLLPPAPSPSLLLEPERRTRPVPSRQFGAKTKCLADAGFFVDLPSQGSVNGATDHILRRGFQGIVALQNASITGGLNQACAEHYAPQNQLWRCFFPQYILPFLHTPLFVLNSANDAWAVQNVWFARALDWGAPAVWAVCAFTFNCTGSQVRPSQASARPLSPSFL